LLAHYYKSIPVSFQSVAAASTNEFCLFQATVRLLGSFWRYWLGSFYQQQKTVKPGPSTGWLKFDSDNFRQIEVIHQILWKGRFQAVASTMGLDSLCGWVPLLGSPFTGFLCFPTHLKIIIPQDFKCDPASAFRAILDSGSVLVQKSGEAIMLAFPPNLLP
jgi:hypothetical protein